MVGTSNDGSGLGQNSRDRRAGGAVRAVWKWWIWSCWAAARRACCGFIIDKPGGVTHEDCANFSREAGTIFDVEDAVPGGTYTLEVSSPGLDRKLSKPADFQRFTGSLVKLMTRDPVNGNRHFEGRLKSFQDGRLRLELTPRKKSKKHEAVEAGTEVEIELGERGEGEPGSGVLSISDSRDERRVTIGARQGLRWQRIMASELYNVIDALSREKGIDPQIVVSAVEDAIVVATRKYYKTQENLRAELDKESGQIRAYAVRSIVETPEQVEDPLSADHTGRRQAHRSRRRSWRRTAHLQADRRSGTHRGAAGQAGHLPEGARGRARHGLQRVHRTRGRDHQRHRQAQRRPGRHRRPRQSRRPHAEERAVAAGVVRSRRARARA